MKNQQRTRKYYELSDYEHDRVQKEYGAYFRTVLAELNCDHINVDWKTSMPCFFPGLYEKRKSPHLGPDTNLSFRNGPFFWIKPCRMLIDTSAHRAYRMLIIGQLHRTPDPWYLHTKFISM